MPPRTKATSFSCPYSKPRTCSLGSLPRFSTSKVATMTSPTSSTNIQIPPESPRFISIPKSVQEQAIYQPYIKGFLPVPRQIFPRKLQKDKTSKEYLEAVTPEPQPPKTKYPNRSKDPHLDYKARQALHRRRNLRESLIELSDRKKRLDHQVASVSAYKQRTNKRLQEAPAHPSEYFTAPSIPLAMQPSRKPLQDPDRTQRIAEMRAKTATKQAEREDDRRDMLHTLYMNARSFITTPAQLAAEVDRVFDDKDQFTNDSVRGENIWNLGIPETVQELLKNLGEGGRKTSDQSGKSVQDILKRLDNSERNTSDESDRSSSLGEKRLNRIAEELTGGKM